MKTSTNSMKTPGAPTPEHAEIWEQFRAIKARSDHELHVLASMTEYVTGLHERLAASEQERDERTRQVQNILLSSPESDKALIITLRFKLLKAESERAAAEKSVAELRASLDAVSPDLMKAIAAGDELLKRAEQRAERCERQADIGAAVERACGELPEGWQIELTLEKGSGTVRLLIPDTDAHEDDFDGDGFVDYINSAIDLASSRQREGQGNG